jgi:NAD(P)-dependent dehydrogenase (short-subunit alcohol dehydrogenase family)
MRLNGPSSSRKRLMPMHKRLAVLTGATSGIGFELASQLLTKEWQLVLVCRDPVKAAQSVIKLKQRHLTANIEIVMCDLADEGDIVHATTEMLKRFPRIDAIFNNAAVSLGEKKLSKHGNELHYQINVIAPYLFMRELAPAVAATAGIIVNTSGVIIELVRNLKLDQLQNPVKFKKFFGAYAQSKLAVTTLTNAVAGTLEKQGIICRSVDPGPAKTPLARGEGIPVALRPFWYFYRSPAKAASYIIDAAFNEKYGKRTGLYVSQGKQASPPASTRTTQLQQALLLMLAKTTAIYK